MGDLESDMAIADDRDAPMMDRLAAARRISAFARTLPRFTHPATSHFDWDRLRVNVFHRAAPELVKWK